MQIHSNFLRISTMFTVAHIQQILKWAGAFLFYSKLNARPSVPTYVLVVPELS